MDVFYKMFPRPIKTEGDADIIDLESDIIPKDVITNWDKDVRRKLLCCVYPGNGNIFDDLMKNYVQSLKEQVVHFKNKKLLKEKLLLHMNVLNSCFKDVEGEFDEFVNYYEYMEEVLTIYCNVELELIGHLSKQENRPNRYLMKIKIASQKICRVLYNNLAYRLVHILHVLLKINYKQMNPSCQSVMKLVYRHFLVKPLTEEVTDEEFCRHYLILQRWKEISKDENISKMEDIFFLKFKKTPDFLETSEIMKTILKPTNNSVSITDILTHIIGYKNAPINAYFNYIKVKRTEEISSIIINVDKASNNMSDNECSRLYNEISNSFSQETVTRPQTIKLNEDESGVMSIDSDSDDDVIETTENTGVCVIDDSDQDSIEYIYLENTATKKHKSRKKAAALLPVTTVIDLDCDPPTTDTTEETPPSVTKDATPTTAPVQNSSTPPPSPPPLSSLSLSNEPSIDVNRNDITPELIETFCDKSNDRTTENTNNEQPSVPTHKSVEIQTDSVTFPYYNILDTPPSDARLDETTPDIDILPENQTSDEIRHVRTRTDSENTSDVDCNDRNDNCNLDMCVITKVETVRSIDASFAKKESQMLETIESKECDLMESESENFDCYDSQPNSEIDNYDSENQDNLLEQSFECNKTVVQSPTKKDAYSESQIKENLKNFMDQSFECNEPIVQTSVKTDAFVETQVEEKVSTFNEHEKKLDCFENATNENLINEIVELETCSVENIDNRNDSNLENENVQINVETQPENHEIEKVTEITTEVEGNHSIDNFNECDNSKTNTMNETQQKVMYTSESIRDTSLDVFSRFEDEMFNQLLTSNTSEFDSVMNGPVSIVKGSTNQFFENSDDNFDLFAYVKNQTLNPSELGNRLRKAASPKSSRSNSPTDSPAYEEIDTNDFRHYMEQGEINLLGSRGEPETDESKKHRRILCNTEDEKLSMEDNRKRKRLRNGENKKRGVVFNNIVTTNYIPCRETMNYSRLRYVKLNNIMCFIDPDDVKLTQDTSVVLQAGVCDSYLSQKDQIEKPKHNTVKSCILSRIDFVKNVEPDEQLEDLSSTENFFDSASNYFPTTGANPGMVDLNTEFSNSPKFLHDSEQLVQQCVAKTFDDNVSQIIDIQPEVTFLSDNSNFYNLKICSESELNMLSENCNLVIEHVQDVDISSLNILGNYENVENVVRLEKSDVNDNDEVDVVGLSETSLSECLGKNVNENDIPDSIIIKGIDCLNDNVESIKCRNSANNEVKSTTNNQSDINCLTEELYACLINDKHSQNLENPIQPDNLYNCGLNPKDKSTEIQNLQDGLKYVSDNAVYYPPDNFNCKDYNHELSGLNILHDLGKNMTTWKIINSKDKYSNTNDGHSFFVNEVNKSKDKTVCDKKLINQVGNNLKEKLTSKCTIDGVGASRDVKDSNDNCNFNLVNRPLYNITYTPTTVNVNCVNPMLDVNSSKNVESYSSCASASENASSIEKNRNFGNVNVANVTLPNITNTNLLNATLSNTNFPNVTLPNTNLPTVTLPNTHLSTVTLPNVTLPLVTMKNVKIPSINTKLSNNVENIKKLEPQIINTHGNIKYLNDCSKLTQRKVNEKIARKAPQKRKIESVSSKKPNTRISVKENLCENLKIETEKFNESIPVPSHHSPSTSSSTDENEIDFNKIYSELNDIELNHLIESLNSGSETRLPFKKRRMSVNVKQEMKYEPKKEEISYPATPMISIAEVEALQNKLNSNRPFKTPAERKEMPPLPVYCNVNSEPSPIITDQFNINNHTYNNPTINYHMSNMPMPFIPCASYFPLPPIILPFNNLATFDHNKAQDVSCGKNGHPQPFKPVKKEHAKNKEKFNYC